MTEDAPIGAPSWLCLLVVAILGGIDVAAWLLSGMSCGMAENSSQAFIDRCNAERFEWYAWGAAAVAAGGLSAAVLERWIPLAVGAALAFVGFLLGALLPA
jgi:hypothetical protein